MTVADEKRRILVRNASGAEEPHRQHAVFRVKLKGDDTWYAVDLAGDQFGQTLPCTDWDNYVQRLGVSSQETKPGGVRIPMDHRVTHITWPRGGCHVEFHMELSWPLYRMLRCLRYVLTF